MTVVYCATESIREWLPNTRGFNQYFTELNCYNDETTLEKIKTSVSNSAVIRRWFPQHRQEKPNLSKLHVKSIYKVHTKKHFSFFLNKKLE